MVRRPVASSLPYFRETPSQTAGPYVHIGLIPHQAGFDIFARNASNVLASPETAGEHIRIEGRVLDGLGSVTKDVLVELWQADAEGRYPVREGDRGHGGEDDRERRSVSFRGFGRTGTDFRTGLYAFETVKPGPVAGRHGGFQAPHVNLWLVARGINIGLFTRLYFSDETAANAADPVLAIVDPPERRETLIARRGERDGTIVYTFDIRLQGEAETVFFDL